MTRDSSDKPRHLGKASRLAPEIAAPPTTRSQECQEATARADPDHMWLISSIGFFSVVRDTHTDGHVLVRARVREDIQALAQRLGERAPKIVHTPERDYAFRISVPAATWVSLAGELAGEIDYPNFKDHVAAEQGYERARTYGHVWSTLLRLQR